MAHWQFWLLPLGYFFVQGSFPVYQPIFALWLKSTKHTIYEINVWPTGQVAVGLVVQILAGVISDSPLLRGKPLADHPGDASRHLFQYGRIGGLECLGQLEIRSLLYHVLLCRCSWYLVRLVC
jgi:hypothetical protein